MSIEDAIDLLHSADNFTNELSEDDRVPEDIQTEAYTDYYGELDKVADLLIQISDQLEFLQEEVDEFHKKGSIIVESSNLYDLQKSEIIEALYDRLSLEQLQEIENKYINNK